MNFSRDTFASHMNGTIENGLDKDSKGSYWFQWGDTSGGLNTHLSYTINDISYRTWSPETSVMPTDLGLLVSCKIDFENGVGDDHIILMAGFLKVKGGHPQLNFVQASVQFASDDDLNIMSAPIKSDPNAPIDIAQALYQSLSDQIHIDAHDTSDTAVGRRSLPNIARLNVNAMIGSVSA